VRAGRGPVVNIFQVRFLNFGPFDKQVNIIKAFKLIKVLQTISDIRLEAGKDVHTTVIRVLGVIELVVERLSVAPEISDRLIVALLQSFTI